MGSPVFAPLCRRRRLRVFLHCLGVISLLVILFYWVERFRGSHAFQQAVAAYKADGESLDIASLLAMRPPDSQNFGATPLLDGMMEPPDKDGIHGPRVVQIKKHLESVSPGRFDFDSPGSINWKDCRLQMASRNYVPPRDEFSDLRAVYVALNREQPLFDELIGASLRPYAVFTPAPADRGAFDAENFRPLTNGLSGWFVLLRLRAIAASALGRADEAVDLARVFWKTRKALLAEPGFYGWFAAHFPANYWLACAREVPNSPGVSDAALQHLLDQTKQDWSPESELSSALRSEAAMQHDWWRKSLPEVEGTFFFEAKEVLLHGRLPTWRNNNFARWCPAGWLRRCAAEDVRRLHLFGVRQARTSGFADLPAAARELKKEDESPGSWFFGYRFMNTRGMGNLLRVMTSDCVRIRRMQLALGMERFRLKYQRYPENTSLLLPDFLSAIPSDIDGHPLRIHTTTDGKSSVIYSVGWNLADDWHGKLPDKYDERDDFENADWAISVPFPPLPVP